MASRVLVESKHGLPRSLADRVKKYSGSSQEPFYRRLELWNREGSARLGYVPGISAEISSLAHSPDGQLLVACDGDGAISVIDVRQPQEQFNFAVGEGVGKIRFSSDSQALVANDKFAWSTSTGNELNLNDVTDDLPSEDSPSLDVDIQAIADAVGLDRMKSPTISPDGKLLAFLAYERRIVGYAPIWLWSLEDNSLRHRLEGHTATVYDLSFSPDSRNLATCGYDQSVRVWDVSTGAELSVFDDHRSSVLTVQFSPDGSMLASGSYDQTVKVWAIQPNLPKTAPWPVRLAESRPFGASPGSDNVLNWSRESSTFASIYEQLESRADFVDEISFNEEAVRKVADEFNAVSLLQYSKGQLRMCTETARQAIKYYERLLENSGEDKTEIEHEIAKACLNLSDAFLKLEEPSLSIEYGQRGANRLQSLVDSVEQNLGLRFLLGGCLNNTGMAFDKQNEYGKSLELYLRAIEIQSSVLEEQPTHLRARAFMQNHRFNLASCYRNLRRFDDALLVLDQAGKSGPDSVALWLKIANQRAEIWLVSRDSDDRDKLCEDLLRALRRACDLGFNSSQIGKEDPVRKVAAQRVEEAWRIVQARESDTESLKRANELCKQAFAVAPNGIRLRAIAAALLFRKSEIDKAHAAFEELADKSWGNMTPDVPIIMAFYALTATRQGDPKQASKAIEKYDKTMHNRYWSNDPILIRIGQEAKQAMNSDSVAPAIE